MKVLFVSNDPSIFDERSPARARMREYASALGELHVLTRASSRSGIVAEGALTLHPLPGGRLRALFSMSRKARSIVEEHGIEVVSAQDPFEHGLAAARAVKGTRAKLHIQIHTDFLSPWFTRSGVLRSARVRAPLMNRVRQIIADRVLPRADGVRAVSGRIRDSVIARYGARVPVPSVIPIAVETVLPPPSPLPPHEFPFALITVSRLEPEKRIEDILHALARTGHEYQSAGLFVVGEGSERKRLETLARNLGLTHRVQFLGWRTDALALMQSAHAYIQASAYEGYGRTLIEAALAKLPIITTDVGIVGEVFRGYEEVLAAPPGDPAALATHIRGLIADHRARILLAQAGERAAHTHLASVGSLPERIRDDLATLAL